MARFTNLTYSRHAVEDAAPRHGVLGDAQYVGTEGDDHIHGRKTPDMIDGLGGNDVLNARYGDDTLNGGDGDDMLKGSAGRDMLYGSDGDDIIFGGTKRQELGQGGAGRDQLFGGAGNDRLYGGWESDVLERGSGKDRFIYTALSDTTIQHSDVIREFEQGRDLLVFRGEYRDLDLLFIGNAEFTHTPGEVRFVTDSSQYVVLIDFDGNGAADSSINFINKVQFQASDFSF